jgi:hypothetical protein
MRHCEIIEGHGRHLASMAVLRGSCHLAAPWPRPKHCRQRQSSNSRLHCHEQRHGTNHVRTPYCALDACYQGQPLQARLPGCAARCRTEWLHTAGGDADSDRPLPRHACQQHVQSFASSSPATKCSWASWRAGLCCCGSHIRIDNPCVSSLRTVPCARAPSGDAWFQAEPLWWSPHIGALDVQDQCHADAAVAGSCAGQDDHGALPGQSQAR